MKFKNENDKAMFEALSMDEKVIRKKLQLVKKSIDRKKQRIAKNTWRRKKHTMLKALRKWHSSTQGKRFHRSLGRFLALREEKSDILKMSIDEVTDALLGLSSIETHLFLELKYYEKDIQALNEFLEILFDFNEDRKSIEEDLIQGYITGEIKWETYEKLREIFEFFIDPKMLLYSFRMLNNQSNDENELNEEEKAEFKRQLKLIEENKFNENLVELLAKEVIQEEYK